MQAVWSLWTKPALRGSGNSWLTERHHLLGWVLSFETARRHYPNTALVTDSLGKRWLVDELGLEFGQVSISLDELNDIDPRFWALGKLYASHEATEPFVHIDSDVFLWGRLPDALEQASVIGQHLELFHPSGGGWYRPQWVAEVLTESGGSVPDAWKWYQRIEFEQSALCCGIVGGNDTRFLNHYAELAIQLSLDPRNRAGWSELLEQQVCPNIHCEQYLLSALLNYHQVGPGEPWPGLRARYLFEPPAVPWNPGDARRLGFTHLIGPAKRNPKIMARLEQRVREEYPHRFERVEQLVASLATSGHQSRSSAPV